MEWIHIEVQFCIEFYYRRPKVRRTDNGPDSITFFGFKTDFQFCFQIN